MDFFQIAFRFHRNSASSTGIKNKKIQSTATVRIWRNTKSVICPIYVSDTRVSRCICYISDRRACCVRTFRAVSYRHCQRIHVDLFSALRKGETWKRRTMRTKKLFTVMIIVDFDRDMLCTQTMSVSTRTPRSALLREVRVQVFVLYFDNMIIVHNSVSSVISCFWFKTIVVRESVAV